VLDETSEGGGWNVHPAGGGLVVRFCRGVDVVETSVVVVFGGSEVVFDEVVFSVRVAVVDAVLVEVESRLAVVEERLSVEEDADDVTEVVVDVLDEEVVVDFDEDDDTVVDEKGDVLAEVVVVGGDKASRIASQLALAPEKYQRMYGIWLLIRRLRKYSVTELQGEYWALISPT
jgi:hypothetical protein